MATFPSYATLLLDGYAEKRGSAILRTEMESGPPKQAKIKSKVMVERPVKIWLKSQADYLRFIDWFADDLDEGAIWFDFTDPVSNTVKQARFVGDGINGQPLDSGMVDWTIDASIETWG